MQAGECSATPYPTLTGPEDPAKRYLLLSRPKTATTEEGALLLLLLLRCPKSAAGSPSAEQ